jgi:hypothetical protein
MEIQQTMECLLAKMDANQAKTYINRTYKIKSGQAEMTSTGSAIEEKMEAAIYSMRAWPAKKQQRPIQKCGGRCKGNGVCRGAGESP